MPILIPLAITGAIAFGLMVWKRKKPAAKAKGK